MGSPGPATELPGLMRNSGWMGACLPSFAASAWKLFHSATILVGAHGLSSVTVSLRIVEPDGLGSSKRLPSYSTIRSASSTPNPTRPSADLKRAHWVIWPTLAAFLHQRPSVLPAHAQLANEAYPGRGMSSLFLT